MFNSAMTGLLQDIPQFTTITHRIMDFICLWFGSSENCSNLGSTAVNYAHQKVYSRSLWAILLISAVVLRAGHHLGDNLFIVLRE